MSERWEIKRPGFKDLYEGPVEFGDGVLKLMEVVYDSEGNPTFTQTRKAYGPGAWEWAERKPEGV